jgi:hypothetical protein
VLLLHVPVVQLSRCQHRCTCRQQGTGTATQNGIDGSCSTYGKAHCKSMCNQPETLQVLCLCADVMSSVSVPACKAQHVAAPYTTTPAGRPLTSAMLLAVLAAASACCGSCWPGGSHLCRQGRLHTELQGRPAHTLQLGIHPVELVAALSVWCCCAGVLATCAGLPNAPRPALPPASNSNPTADTAHHGCCATTTLPRCV